MANDKREIKNCLVNLMGRFLLSILSFSTAPIRNPTSQVTKQHKQMEHSDTTEVLPFALLVKIVSSLSQKLENKTVHKNTVTFYLNRILSVTVRVLR